MELILKDEAGLAISLKKCLFSVPSLDFLGYRLDANGLTPLPRKIEAITSFPRPGKPKALKGFLGALNFYRRSLPKLDGKNAAELLQPLYDMCNTKVPNKTFAKVWEEKEMDVHFQKAKDLLTLAVQLNHPDPAAPLSLA